MKTIKNFMCTCLSCNTGVRFDVPDSFSVGQMLELSNVLGNLTCPKCATSLGEDALKAFDTIKVYNKAVYEFEHLHTNIKLSFYPDTEDDD